MLELLERLRHLTMKGGTLPHRQLLIYGRAKNCVHESPSDVGLWKRLDDSSPFEFVDACTNVEAQVVAHGDDVFEAELTTQYRENQPSLGTWLASMRGARGRHSRRFPAPEKFQSTRSPALLGPMQQSGS